MKILAMMMMAMMAAGTAATVCENKEVKDLKMKSSLCDEDEVRDAVGHQCSVGVKTSFELVGNQTQYFRVKAGKNLGSLLTQLTDIKAGDSKGFEGQQPLVEVFLTSAVPVCDDDSDWALPSATAYCHYDNGKDSFKCDDESSRGAACIQSCELRAEEKEKVNKKHANRYPNVPTNYGQPCSPPEWFVTLKSQIDVKGTLYLVGSDLSVCDAEKEGLVAAIIAISTSLGSVLLLCCCCWFVVCMCKVCRRRKDSSKCCKHDSERAALLSAPTPVPVFYSYPVNQPAPVNAPAPAQAPAPAPAAQPMQPSTPQQAPSYIALYPTLHGGAHNTNL